MTASLSALLERNLARQRRRVLAWALALGALAVIEVAIYPSIDTSAFHRLVRTYPPELLKAFRIEHAADLSTVQGFLAAELFSFLVPLAVAFFPILASAAAIAGAEERGTLEVLLGNPLPRWLVVVASFGATGLALLGVLALLGLIMLLAALVWGVDLPVSSAAAAVFNLWPLSMFFGGFALLLSALLRRRALVSGIAAAVVVGSYMVDVLAGFSDTIEKVQPISVFHHYGSAIQHGIDWPSFVAISGVAVAWAALAAFAFERREILA